MASGNKTPASLKSFEAELKRAEKELEELEKKKIEIDVSINQEQSNYSKFVKNGDTSSADKSARRINSFDTDAVETEKRIDILKSKANELSSKIEDIKFSPQNTEEVKQLQKQLALAESKLDSSKKKANELKNEMKDTSSEEFSKSLDKANIKAKKLGTTLLSVFSKTKPFKSINNQLNSLNKKVGQLGKRITGLITGALVFNVLSSGLSKLSSGLIGVLNSNSQFASSLNQIKVNLLTAFAPIYNYVLPALNNLMTALSSITGQIATFVSGLFGQTATQAKNGAKSIYEQSKAYQDLGKNAKSAKNGLSSIDEIENLNDNENNTSGGASEGEIPSLDFSGEIEQSGKLLDYLNEIKKLISQGDFFGVGQKIASSINNALVSFDIVKLTDKISAGMQNTVQVFNGFINELDFSLLGTKFSQLGTGITRAIADAIKAVDWNNLGKGISDFITNIEWGQLAINIFDTIWNAISGIGTMLLAIDWGSVAKKLSDGTKQLWEHITKQIQSVDWRELGSKIITAIIDYIANIDYIGITLDLMKGLAVGITAAIDLVVGAFDALWKAILNFFGIHSPSTLAAEMGTYLIQGLINGIQSLKDNVLNFFGSLWSSIKNIFGNNVASWFRDTFANAWQAVKNVFSAGGKIFDGIKDGILNGLKLVINGLISGINKTITIPFKGINSALTKIKNIDILGAKPFKGLINTISVPQIPYLAKGAVIPPNAQFAAILGDQKHGRNLEAPEDLIRQIVREEGASNEMISLLIDLNKNILSLSNMCAVLNIDTTEIARALFKPLEDERNRQQLSTTVVRS